MKYLIPFLISGCTLSVQIDTEYASQNASDGDIAETTQSEATASPEVDVTADISGEEL